MPVIAKESNATVIEINLEKTPLTDQISDYILLGKSGEVMNRIMARMERFD